MYVCKHRKCTILKHMQEREINKLKIWNLLVPGYFNPEKGTKYYESQDF